MKKTQTGTVVDVFMHTYRQMVKKFFTLEKHGERLFDLDGHGVEKNNFGKI